MLRVSVAETLGVRLSEGVDDGLGEPDAVWLLVRVPVRVPVRVRVCVRDCDRVSR